jgi:hypothetical protein
MRRRFRRNRGADRTERVRRCLDGDVHTLYDYVHGQRSEEATVGSPAARHKHVQLNQEKLNRARALLGAKTETETLDRALDLVLNEAAIDTALRKARGKGRLKKVFR